jgi:hypothetical protein
MTHACPACELAADTYLLILQYLKDKVLRAIGNFPKCTLVSDLHMAFNLQCIYDSIAKSCRHQAEVTKNHENEHVRSIRQGEAKHRKYKRLKLGGGQTYDCSCD